MVQARAELDDKELFRWRQALSQVRFLAYELRLIVGGRRIPRFHLLCEPSAGVLVSYRLDRCFYLLFGQAWTGLRVLAYPVFLLLRLLSCRHELCFKADIGRGLRVTHPTLGVVVHGDAIVGEDCTLHGGNSIGVRKPMRRGELVLGNQVAMGINSCVLGPVRVGSRVHIGAGAIVVTDLPDDCVAVGVPAQPRKAKPAPISSDCA